MLKTLTEPKSNPLVELYSIVQQDLKDVERMLAKELSSNYPFVNELLSKSRRLSGKRLRPALLLLFGKAVGKVGSEHIQLATAIEMIHTATLVHDDVLDSAESRRHAQTLNSEYGNQVAILTGDFLFSHAFFLTSTLSTTFAAQEIGRSTNRVCEGEMRQVGTKKNYALSEQEYIEIIDAKTAVLCSCAAKLGAYYGGGDQKTVEAAADYGTCLGIAFQIVDDVLDLLGNESETGKSLGTDLLQHKPTLPMIHCLQNLGSSARDNFLDRLVQDDVPLSEVHARLQESGSIDYAYQKAQNYIDRALDTISGFQPSPALHALNKLPEFVLARSH